MLLNSRLIVVTPDSKENFIRGFDILSAKKVATGSGAKRGVAGLAAAEATGSRWGFSAPVTLEKLGAMTSHAQHDSLRKKQSGSLSRPPRARRQ